MSKCLKCGASLPPVGDCPACAAAQQPAAPFVPSLLDKEIQIDRRGPERAPAPVPAFADLARGPGPMPSGMTPNRPPPAPPAVAPLTPRVAPQPPAAAPRAAQPPAAAPRAAPPPAPHPQAAPRAAPPPPGPRPQVAAPRAAMPPPPAAPAPSLHPRTMTPAQFPAVVPPAAPRAAMPPPPPPSAPAPQFPGVAAPRPRQAAAAQALPQPPAPSEEALTLDMVERLARSVAAEPLFLAPAPEAAPMAHPVAPPPAPAPAVAAQEEDDFPGSVDVEWDAEQPAPPAMAAAPEAPPDTRLPPPPAPKALSMAARSAALPVNEVHARPAALWRRLLAFGVDTATIASVAGLYLALASTVTGVKKPEPGLNTMDTLFASMQALKSVLLPGIVLVLLLALVYCAVSAFLFNGRTLGRRLLGLRLVDTHGLAPAPGRAVVRALLSAVSFGLFLGGFWMALFDRRGQTLHDKLTSTFVVQPS